MDSIDWLWDEPASHAKLTPDQAQIWTFALTGAPARMAELTELLTPDERQRAGKFGSEELRNRFIVGRASLRQILGHSLGCQPGSLLFRHAERGKPELDGPHAGRLHFNLSHSGPVGLVAVAQCSAVGVDIERLRPVWNPQQIASRFFTEAEGKQLEGVPEPERPAAFFRLWTRKEAWLKATGEGIAESLDRVEVSFMAHEPPQVLSVANEPGTAGLWTLVALVPAKGFVGALAVRARSLNISCWRWSNGAK